MTYQQIFKKKLCVLHLFLWQQNNMALKNMIETEVTSNKNFINHKFETN